jgi:hypothetical protein
VDVLLAIFVLVRRQSQLCNSSKTDLKTSQSSFICQRAYTNIVSCVDDDACGVPRRGSEERSDQSPDI